MVGSVKGLGCMCMCVPVVAIIVVVFAEYLMRVLWMYKQFSCFFLFSFVSGG